MIKELEIQPNELSFEVNEDSKSATKSLSLRNSNSNFFLIFKIRTSGKNRYTVKPNCGVIPTNSVIQVSITCALSPGDDTSKPLLDKFVIYSICSTIRISAREEIDDYLARKKSECSKRSLNSNVRFPQRLVHLRQSEDLDPRLTSNILGTNPYEDPVLLNTEILESAFSGSQEVKSGLQPVEFGVKKGIMSSFHRRKTEEDSVLSNMKGTAKFDFGRRSNRNLEHLSQVDVQVRKDVFLSKSNKTISVDFQTAKYDFPVFHEHAKIEHSEIRNDHFGKMREGSFQGWQLLVAALVGVIIGAYLNGN